MVRVDEAPLGCERAKIGAQPFDVNIDDSVTPVKRSLPHLLEDKGARQDPLLILEEHDKEIHLSGLEPNSSRSDGDKALHGIDMQRVHGVAADASLPCDTHMTCR